MREDPNPDIPCSSSEADHTVRPASQEYFQPVQLTVRDSQHPVQRVERPGAAWRTERRPELIQLDPAAITFNPYNARRHTGTDFVRLQQSIKEVGLVQYPLVR